MGETLKKRFGPLPVWAWTAIFVAVLALYLIWKKKKADAAAAAAAAQQQSSGSSNLGTVPVSNLTTAAQPMPIQMGDTFVNTSVDSENPDSPWRKPPSWWMQNALPPAMALRIGTAENKGAVQAAGGNPLVALSRAGLSQQDVKNLAAAGQAGGGNFLVENAVRKQAGLPYYTSAGLQPGTAYNGVPF